METKGKIRDLFHGILGIAPSYLVFTLTMAFSFTNQSKVIGVSLVSALFGAIINGVFNWFQGKLHGIKSGREELFIGAIGGMFGGNLALFMPNALTAWVLFIVCIGICATDLLTTKKQ